MKYPKDRLIVENDAYDFICETLRRQRGIPPGCFPWDEFKRRAKKYTEEQGTKNWFIPATQWLSSYQGQRDMLINAVELAPLTPRCGWPDGDADIERRLATMSSLVMLARVGRFANYDDPWPGSAHEAEYKAARQAGPLVTMAAAARLQGITDGSMAEWIDLGLVRSWRVDRQRMIPEADLAGAAARVAQWQANVQLSLDLIRQAEPPKPARTPKVYHYGAPVIQFPGAAFQ